MHLDTIDLFCFSFRLMQISQQQHESDIFVCWYQNFLCVKHMDILDGRRGYGLWELRSCTEKAFWIVNQPVSKLWMFFFSMSENQNQGVKFSIDQSLTIVKLPIKLTL